MMMVFVTSSGMIFVDSETSWSPVTAPGIEGVGIEADGAPGAVGRDGVLGAGEGARVDGRAPVKICCSSAGDLLGLAVLNGVDIDLGTPVELLVVEDLDKLEQPLHVGVRVRDDHHVALGHVDDDGIGRHEGLEQTDDLRGLDVLDGNHLQHRFAGDGHPRGVPAVTDRRGLLGDVADGDDPVEAVFLDDPDAVEPEDHLHDRKDVFVGHGGHGAEGDPPFHPRVDHVIDPEDIAEDRLDDAVNVGIVKIEAHHASATRW